MAGQVIGKPYHLVLARQLHKLATIYQDCYPQKKSNGPQNFFHFHIISYNIMDWIGDYIGTSTIYNSCLPSM